MINNQTSTKVVSNQLVPNKMKRKRWSDNQIALALIIPPILFILTFTLLPILKVFWLSLHNISVTEPWLGTPFVGIKNYINIMQDSRFWHSLGFTISFSVITVLFETAIGIFLAIIAHKTFKFRGLVRAAILFPWALPTITNALTWRWMFNQDYGLFNSLLMKAHIIDEPLNWLGNSTLAYIAICIVAIWKTSSFMAIIILPGLQSIPDDLYESAKIDGASRFQSFFFITLPLLRNVLLVALVLRTLGTMQAFDLMYGLTGGGPGNATESLPMYIYQTAFVDLHWGYGSALSVILFFVILIFAGLYVKFLYRTDY
jgi:ABC-type sugar transport system permease subunit